MFRPATVVVPNPVPDTDSTEVEAVVTTSNNLFGVDVPQTVSVAYGVDVPTATRGFLIVPTPSDSA